MYADTIESILRSSHQLARVAAHATGSRTPALLWRTLAILESEGPQRVGELAAHARTPQPGMTRLLATLVEDELVLRIADTDDSRAWLIKATPKGLRALAEWRSRLAETLEPWFGDLSLAEWNTLARAAAILEAHTDQKAGVA